DLKPKALHRAFRRSSPTLCRRSERLSLEMENSLPRFYQFANSSSRLPVVPAFHRFRHRWPALAPSSFYESFHSPEVRGFSPTFRWWVIVHNSLPRYIGCN
ncbi:hypothetical protein HAX54_029701, partial [Datura stramonium]|nr:hypothetical protein [Datura stramonium]